MTSNGEGNNSSVDAIMKVVNKRKTQLHMQQQSVSQANEEAEGINLLSFMKTKKA